MELLAALGTGDHTPPHRLRLLGLLTPPLNLDGRQDSGLALFPQTSPPGDLTWTHGFKYHVDIDEFQRCLPGLDDSSEPRTHFTNYLPLSPPITVTTDPDFTSNVCSFSLRLSVNGTNTHLVFQATALVFILASALFFNTPPCISHSPLAWPPLLWPKPPTPAAQPPNGTPAFLCPLSTQAPEELSPPLPGVGPPLPQP